MMKAHAFVRENIPRAMRHLKKQGFQVSLVLCLVAGGYIGLDDVQLHAVMFVLQMMMTLINIFLVLTSPSICTFCLLQRSSTVMHIHGNNKPHLHL